MRIKFVPTVDIGFGLEIDGILHRIAANTPETRAELEAAETLEKALAVLFGKDGCRAAMQAIDSGACSLTELVYAAKCLFYTELVKGEAYAE